MPVMCYICGREFGRTSINIHIPQCVKKWDAEQLKLPKSQRRPAPTAPTDFDRAVNGELKGKELQQYNDQAFDDYNKQALAECANCHRTFLPKSLEVHQRSCKAPAEPKPRKDTPAAVLRPVKKRADEAKPRSPKPMPPPQEIEVKAAEEEPTRKDLVALINGESVFDSAELRAEALKCLKGLTVKE